MKTKKPKPHAEPLDWAKVEAVMVRVMRTGKARISDMNLLTRAFHASPRKYDETRDRAKLVTGDRSPVS